MQMSVLDILLSTGVEGFNTPPSSFVEATPVEVIKTQTAITNSLAEAALAETDLKTAQQNIADLTRLGGGLEGLMIEVTRVENKNDPTTEELAALRVAAMSVRRDLLNEDERRLVDELAEGRLEGSVEGLGDLLKSVSTKLGFAVGNFWDGVKRNFSSGKSALDGLDRKLEDLIGRVRNLPDVPFERVLSKDDAVMFMLNDKVDPKAVAADIVGAVEDWFYRPMNVLLYRIAKLSDHLRLTMATKTEEEYLSVIESEAALYATPIPEGAKKVDVVNGKHYIFDLFDVHSSYGGRQRTVYAARPNPNTQLNSPQYDNAAATGVSFVSITLLRGMRATPTKVTLTKEDLLNILLQLQRAVKELAVYLKNQDAIGKAYGDYCRATGGYQEFQKNTFVTKMVLHRTSIQASAILSLFEMTCPPVGAIASDLDQLASIMKSFVYSSDLSKG
ncbi:hypothetical protein pEaSNUABM37_00335 [Erwinia phage pEa_SNUABM_37]|nr:hypothetical protein pEaSNUABM37_00335 [Erwinia phage pEa_SNUABM_37]QXO10803.1 hypothetical protein pEaSNUABM48_00335 [Erwinia phage pEa_SNUABM_48]